MKIKELLTNYKRVVQIARKPDKDEFKITSKVCAIGMALIGLIGFIVFILFVLLGLR
jgi:protein transport protein SEC61 subunit gamma-like protein